MVNSKSAVDKSKRSSALSTAQSVLPEIVACEDDGGVGALVPNSTKYICCTATDCASGYDGHTAKWPNIFAQTGWNYDTANTTGSIINGDYIYIIKAPSGIISPDIKCSVASNTCCDVGSVGC